ncbi:hypothetical protein FRC17_010363 [Serendipita sp. 399]|nr:hypothetical protein FRC17_010363 [Serendipita sp. 399]
MTSPASPNLDNLVHRIIGLDVTEDQTSPQHDSYSVQWLERLLDHWIAAEDEFWEVTLEKEELETSVYLSQFLPIDLTRKGSRYNRAAEFQLISEDEYTPETYQLSSYQRPSVIRESQTNAKAVAEAEERETKELKDKRRSFRSTLSKARTAFDAANAKITALQKRIDQQRERLNDYDKKVKHTTQFVFGVPSYRVQCNSLLTQCVEANLQPAIHLASEFASVTERTSEIQTITRLLGERYQNIRNLWDTIHVILPEEEIQESGRQAWVLTRGYANLEARLCQQEIESTLGKLKNGVSWEELSKDVDDIQPSTPSALVVKRLLESAWNKDQSVRLTEELRLLHELYVCLTRLHINAAGILARSEALIAELEQATEQLHESRFQAPLNEDDDLLIRLASLLNVDADEAGEISADTVLDRLRALKSTKPE